MNHLVPDKETIDLVTFYAGVATILAMPFGVGAVWYAARQLSLARKAGSGASLIAPSEAFRQCWREFLSASDDTKRRYAFGDLANSLEVACAVFRDKVFFGRSADLLENYLVSVFPLIEGNAEARARMESLLQTSRTFENVVEFLKNHRDEGLPRLPTSPQ